MFISSVLGFSLAFILFGSLNRTQRLNFPLLLLGVLSKLFDFIFGSGSLK